jgi:hypothetical protein
VAFTDRPTEKQLALLRSLALRRGETFAYPLNRLAASSEIRRLLAGKASRGDDR